MNPNILHTSFDFGFALMGIAAPVKDYHFCWHLNRALGLNLTRTEDLRQELCSDRINYLSKFSYFREEGEREYFLLANKGLEGFLIADCPEFDFFLLVHNLNHDSDRERLLEKVKAIVVTESAELIDAEFLEARELLLF